MKITLKRQNDAVNFLAFNEDGIKVSIDGSPEIGGENLGARPMQLLIMGLGGCSAIDVVMILKKQKVNPEDIQIELEAERFKDQTPALFETIKVSFKIKGSDADAKKIKRAVELSMEKYCSVAKILEATASISFDTYLNNNLL